MKKRFTIVTTLLLFALCGDATAQSKNDDALRKERSSLEHISNPVDRTKTDIRIADLLILLLADAARTDNEKLVEQHLKDYVLTIQDAQQAIMKTGTDAHKHPAGFKDLEISLRKQQRKLEDISNLVGNDQRPEILKAKQIASDIDDQVIKAMLLKDPNASKH